MFQPTAMEQADLDKMVEKRTEFMKKWAAMLGSKNFFGGDKPTLGDFWVASNVFALERNTKGGA